MSTSEGATSTRAPSVGFLMVQGFGVSGLGVLPGNHKETIGLRLRVQA